MMCSSSLLGLLPVVGCTMPINVYTGLQRSGKSYEVVSEVILPAVRAGRRVVTNVDGISESLIHKHLALRHPSDDKGSYGSVLHVENAQVFLPDFFPYYDDQKGAHIDTVVQPGDLVAIDEAWRFWGATDCKLHKNHKSFFLEHGHFTDPATNIACDLVLMIQDMSTLNRFVKNVVAFNFRTHKKISLGLTNTYSVNMWEGYKQSKASLLSSSVRQYNKDVFPLYSSFKGGGSGILVNADARQNILASKKLWLLFIVLIVGAVVCFYNVYRFFTPVSKPEKATSSPASAVVAGAPSQLGNAVSAPLRSSDIGFSESWRIAGSYSAQGRAWIVLVSADGRVRLESPSMFENSGLVQIGQIDGARVGSFTGGLPRSHSASQK